MFNSSVFDCCSRVHLPSVPEAVQESRGCAQTQAHPCLPQAGAGLPHGGLRRLLLLHLQPAEPHPQGAPQGVQVQVLLPRLPSGICHAGE